MTKSILLFLCLLSTMFSAVIGQTTINGEVYRVTENQACDATSPTIPMPDIILDIFDADTGSPISSPQTASDGTYSATIGASTTNIRIVPVASGGIYDDWNLNVTTYDITLITQFLVGFDALNCPFQRIAADVDDSGAIDSPDTLLIRDLILGNSTHFPKVSNWRFVSRNYVRTDSGNKDIRFPLDFWNNASWDQNGNQYPFLAIYTYPTEPDYLYTGTAAIWMDALNIYPVAPYCEPAPNWDFYGLKSGDVSQNNYTLPNFTEGDNSEEKQSRHNVETDFSTNLKSNTIYQIDVVVAALEKDIVAYQLALNLNPSIQVKEIQTNDKLEYYNSNRHFSIHGDSDKEIRTSWVQHQLEGVEMEADFVPFSIVIEVEADMNLSEAVFIDESLMPIEFVSENLELVPANLSIKVKEL